MPAIINERFDRNFTEGRLLILFIIVKSGEAGMLSKDILKHVGLKQAALFQGLSLLEHHNLIRSEYITDKVARRRLYRPTDYGVKYVEAVRHRFDD